MVLVDGEPQVQQLQLPVVSIEEVAAGGAVLARAPHVLAQPIEGGTLLVEALRIVPVGIADVVLERADPVDLGGLLERARYHGRLHHLDGRAERTLAPGRDRLQRCRGIEPTARRGGRCSALGASERWPTVG